MRVFAAFWILFPSLCFSQALKVSSIDNFIKKYRIELAPVPVYLSSKGKASLSFSSADTSLFVQIGGSGWGAVTINEGDELIFLFSNGQSVKARSSSLQTFEPGLQKSTYKHQYLLSAQDVLALSRYELVGIRKYSFTDFSDIQIEKQYRARVQKLSAVFANEITKSGIIKTLKSIKLQDIAQHVGDSVLFCSKVYNTRYYEASGKKPTVLDVQSDFLDPLVNVVILEEDRKKFLYPPEKVFLNKDVCISGVVTMHNNVPYIFIHNREQIQVKSAVTLEEIGLFIGDSVTVSGVVFTTRYFTETANQPTVLNIGAPYPNQLLTVVIEKSLRDEFAEKPEVLYLNKEVSVSGKVILYRNKPEIVIKDKSQLTVLNNSNFLPVKYKDTTAASPDNVRHAADRTDETPAQFPGGFEALASFLNRNLVLPDQLKSGETKTVVANFYVGTDGTVSNLKINKSAGTIYDVEVMRVLGRMPKWKPRTKGGAVEGVQVKLPVTFQKIGLDE
jgi:hypothetical protein